MNTLSKTLTLILMAVVLLLSACKKDAEVPGQPPTANAGADLTGTVGNSVALVGTASDPDGDALTTSWSIVSAPSGSSATVSSPGNLTTSFVPDVAGPYTLKLTASDGSHDPVSDEVVVTAEESVGEPPVVVIRNDQGTEITADNKNTSAALGSSYVLDGSGSYDPENAVLTYAWEVTKAPDNADYTLTESSDKKTATFAPKTTGDYTFRLSVTDPDQNTATKEVTLSAMAETIIITQDVIADTTWADLFADPAIPDYYVNQDIDVTAKLTIQPGVVIHFKEDATLRVPSGGALMAQGTADKGIVFTTEDEAGAVHWNGLYIESSSAQNVLDYVTVAFAGGGNLIYQGGYKSACIGIDEDAKLKILNTTIANSDADGIFVSGTSSITEMKNNVFRNNARYAMSVSINQTGTIDQSNVFEDNTDTERKENIVHIYDSNMSAAQEWFALNGGGIYYFSGNTSVSAALTIHEGARLEFAEGTSMSIATGGQISAVGTADNHVVFTSDNTSDGIKWAGLYIASSNQNNVLNYVEITHAGNGNLIYDGGYQSANLAVDNEGKVAITNSVIAEGNSSGLYVNNGEGLVSFGNNTFTNNVGGYAAILLPPNAAGMIDSLSTFAGNKLNGVYILKRNYTSEANFTDDSNKHWVKLSGEAFYNFVSSIELQAPLTIAPGTMLKFNPNVILTITSTGYLNATGTADQQITFTSLAGSGDNWGGILFESSNANNALIYTQILYAGNANTIYDGGYKKAAIGVDSGAKLKLMNTTVANSSDYGLWVSGGTVNDITEADPEAVTKVTDANTFSDNGNEDVVF